MSAVALPQLHAEQQACRSAPPAPPAPVEIRAQRRLIDSHGRAIRDLRISITDRCNFRCVYCMEPDVRFMAARDVLSADEIVRLARVAEGLGVRKVRLTGGEPTLRDDLEEIIAGIRGATSLEIALITNGSRLDRAAAARWKRAGLGRVSISIDSLSDEAFARVTRSPVPVARVIGAIEACIAEGLTPVKVNAVLIRGVNDGEAPALAGLARELGVEVRFIEFMPLDSARAWDSSRVVTAAETRRAIEREFPLVPTGTDAPDSTAVTYRFADAPHGAPGRIGFIAPVSNPFCGACSRLRITADGKVRPCLFSVKEWDIRGLLRASASDDELAEFLIDAVWTKQAGHGISSSGFEQPERTMSAIGG